MGYEEMWKVLADLTTDLRKRGERIPTTVMDDLRSAKTMIQILKADPTHIENLPRIETYLENVESHVILLAQNKFELDYVEQWMKKLEEARREIYRKGEEKALSKFVPGLPRGERWVRIQVSEDTPRKDIEELARENRLSYKMQKNGYILVYGDGEKIKVFVKRIGGKFRRVER